MDFKTLTYTQLKGCRRAVAKEIYRCQLHHLPKQDLIDCFLEVGDIVAALEKELRARFGSACY